MIESGDTALLHAKWTSVGTDAAGNRVDVAGQSTEVVRRQADGTWLFVIDNHDHLDRQPTDSIHKILNLRSIIVVGATPRMEYGGRMPAAALKAKHRVGVYPVLLSR